MTNLEREKERRWQCINEMTAQEFVYEFSDYYSCDACIYQYPDCVRVESYHSCLEGLKEWLESEAEE